ncbi:MAG: hypothetical protein AAB853_04280, partial [Patescibacteria group bacterium]
HTSLSQYEHITPMASIHHLPSLPLLEVFSAFSGQPLSLLAIKKPNGSFPNGLSFSHYLSFSFWAPKDFRVFIFNLNCTPCCIFIALFSSFH